MANLRSDVHARLSTLRSMKLSPVLAFMVLVAIVSPASADPNRTLSTPYRAGSAVYASSDVLIGARCGSACVTFTGKRGERQADISVYDASGLPVGWIASRGNEGVKAGCGTGRLSLRGGGEWAVTTAYVPGCPAPTVGELKVLIK